MGGHNVKLRTLPPGEWYRLAPAYEDCRAEDPLPLPKTTEGVIIVAEDASKIVGCVGAERSWQVSPLWIDKEYRGNGLPLELAALIKNYNTQGLAEMVVTTNPHVELLVYKLGFIPIPGTLWRRE